MKVNWKKLLKSKPAGIGSRKLLLTAVIFALALAAAAQSTRIAPDVDTTDDVDVIVQYYHEPDANEIKAAKELGAQNGRHLGLIHAQHFTMDGSALQNLVDSDSNIKYVSPDRPVEALLDNAVVAIGADTAHNLGYDGTGVGVAVIDSGVNAVNDLSSGKTSRVVYNQNFDTSATTTSDLYGHGTHVAGIIAGNGANSTCGNCVITFKGIAPNANIINLRVLNQNGSATDSEVISAIQEAISLKNTYNIRVINLSLGRGVFESYALDPLCQAVEQAWNAGIVVVVAAGNYGRDNSSNNNGYGTITSPGMDPYAITVGAMKTMGTPTRVDDLIASYSSKGPTLIDHFVKPDLVAPGNLIISSLASTSSTLYGLAPSNVVPVSYYTSSNDNNSSSSYFHLSGTSMAAGMVSGAVALLLQQNPALTPDQVKARLMKTAYKTFPLTSSYTDPSTGITYTSQYDIFTVGAGYVDVAAALANTDLAPTTTGVARSPKVYYDANSHNVYLVQDSSLLWGSSLTWGTTLIWGSTVNLTPAGQTLVWGSSVCWGSSSSSGFSVLWGSSVTWGSSTESDATAISLSGDH